MELNKIYQGEALDILKSFPDESIDMLITSPPYWALRDYGTASWDGGNKDCDHLNGSLQSSRSTLGGRKPEDTLNDKRAKSGMPFKDTCGKCGAKRIDLQLGLEPTFQEYITKLCDIFDEVKRVLKKSGTCWVNLGDTYAGGNGNTSDYERGRNSCIPVSTKLTAPSGKPKSAKVDGVQNKSLCQIPSRFAIEMTNRGWILRNEIIWHKPNCMPSSVKDRFTVDFEKIFFFVKNKKYYFETQYEPHKSKPHKYSNKKYNDIGKTSRAESDGSEFYNEKGRNKRTVWKITTKPYKEAHFATYPEALIETPIKAGCPKDGIVLDPFMGSGTTALVARNLGRKYVGIELNPEYIKLAEKRLQQQVLIN